MRRTCLAMVAFAMVIAGTAQAGTPLTAAQVAEIAARAAATGYTVDVSATWETVEDQSILYVPAVGDAGVMLLFDTVTQRAVLVQEQGDAGYHLTVVQPEASAVPIEVDLGGDGYFAPENRLEALGVSDAILANVQAHTCQQGCFDQPNHLGCAACTGVTILVALRDPAAWQVGPTPELSPTQDQGQNLTPASTPTDLSQDVPTAELQVTATEVPDAFATETPSAEATEPVAPGPVEAQSPGSADVLETPWPVTGGGPATPPGQSLGLAPLSHASPSPDPDGPAATGLPQTSPTPVP